MGGPGAALPVDNQERAADPQWKMIQPAPGIIRSQQRAKLIRRQPGIAGDGTQRDRINGVVPGNDEARRLLLMTRWPLCRTMR